MLTPNHRNTESIDEAKSILQELFLPKFIEKGVRVFIKRDDLIHSVVSGNKWRKLKYLIANAKEIGVQELVSFGGAFSNHLPALAFAAKTFDLRSAAFVRGDELNHGSNEHLKFCDDFGMNLHFVGRDEYKDKKKLFDGLYQSPKSLFVDEGGKSFDALKGCEEIVKEIIYQKDGLNLANIHHIILPVGTGTTIAGVALAFSKYSPETKVHGIVVLKGAEYLNEEIQQLVPGLNNYQLHHKYHFGGYAKTTTELELNMHQFYAATKIKTEYIYSGKMIAAANHLLQLNKFKENETAVMIHTGGIWG